MCRNSRSRAIQSCSSPTKSVKELLRGSSKTTPPSKLPKGHRSMIGTKGCLHGSTTKSRNFETHGWKGLSRISSLPSTLNKQLQGILPSTEVFSPSTIKYELAQISAMSYRVHDLAMLSSS